MVASVKAIISSIRSVSNCHICGLRPTICDTSREFSRASAARLPSA